MLCPGTPTCGPDYKQDYKQAVTKPNLTDIQKYERRNLWMSIVIAGCQANAKPQKTLQKADAFLAEYDARFVN